MPGGGGVAECDEASLTTAAKEATSTGGFGMLMDGTPVPAGTAFESYQSSNCADGWALVGANVTSSGQTAGALFLFQAEGQFWVPKSVAEACAGADVPEALRAAGCQFAK